MYLVLIEEYHELRIEIIKDNISSHHKVLQECEIPDYLVDNIRTLINQGNNESTFFKLLCDIIQLVKNRNKIWEKLKENEDVLKTRGKQILKERDIIKDCEKKIEERDIIIEAQKKIIEAQSKRIM